MGEHPNPLARCKAAEHWCYQAKEQQQVHSSLPMMWQGLWMGLPAHCLMFVDPHNISMRCNVTHKAAGSTGTLEPNKQLHVHPSS
eukprot:1150049-Pelagomonas_calceolata.AAC.8